VNIPAGVDSGSQIRLSGEGEAGPRNGEPGDLYIVIQVKPHAVLKRNGTDIVYELPLSVAQAALGDAICNLFESQGWRVTREFYYNDAGAQIATLAAGALATSGEAVMAIERRGQQLDHWMQTTQALVEVAKSASAQVEPAVNLAARQWEQEGKK